MYLSSRAIFIRNTIVSGVNGAITLILLLIAPLGLAAVLTNTVLIAASTFATCSLGDFVVGWLLRSRAPSYLAGEAQQQGMRRSDRPSEMDRR
ncbi:MAG: CRISPR-associated protein Csx18 [Cyanobacteriota bacterium]|nr:CRISPR-associated protein Csx18 [Cyanobacteriota bacterium]